MIYQTSERLAPRGWSTSLCTPVLLGALVISTGVTAASAVEAPPEYRDARVLLEWNELGLATAAEDDQFQTLRGNRSLPLMHLAIHDALNAIVPIYETYRHSGSNEEAHPIAAVSQAAHDVLADIYPDQAEAFAMLHERWLGEVPQGDRKARGTALGAAAAATILEARSGDGYDSEGSFTPGDTPGAYRITPPFEEPVGTGWAETTPLGMHSPDQFRPGPPPAIDSDRYAEEFDEVKRLGRRDSEVRTADQTHIGHWWAEYTTVGYPDFARTRVVEDDIHLWQTARLFALLAMDNFDALISAWDAKYEYQYWRPYTAIRNADQDGNPATRSDPEWEPEMMTPPHPDYPAALSTLCAGGAEVLKAVLGEDIGFTRESGSAPEGTPATRSYDNLDATVESCMLSRIYNGFHFRAGLEAGVEMGRERAHHLLDHHLTPVAEE